MWCTRILQRPLTVCMPRDLIIPVYILKHVEIQEEKAWPNILITLDQAKPKRSVLG